MIKSRTFIFISALFSIILLTACKAPDTGPRLFLGNADAPILIEEFSDLQCPACASISPQVEKIVRKNPALARLEYYHFPLTYHQYAFKAAEAAECAADRGKFWAFVNSAFENQSNLAFDGLVAIGKNIGLDENDFRKCIESGEKKAKVRADQAEGRRRKLPGTPTFFVNGQMVKWGGAAQFEAYLKNL